MTNILIAESVDIKTLENFSKENNINLFSQDEIIPTKNDEISIYYKPDISVEEIEEESQYYNAILTRPKEITSKAISSSDNLKLIIRGGSGVNSIALEAAKSSGVVVENTPGLNSTATAEYTFNLIFSLLARREIFRSVYDVRINNMRDPLHYCGSELEGKSIAIIGLGNIGKRMAIRCEAFGMKVFAYNRSHKDDVKCFQSQDLHEILKKQADIVSLHIPLAENTRNIIDEKEFSLMKKGTILLNTARPPLVSSQAFHNALVNEIISCAGIDGDPDVIAPFVDADPQEKCLITHHIADATFEAQQKITQQMLYQALAFFTENKEINRVV